MNTNTPTAIMAEQSGRYLDFTALTPDDIDFDDVAHGIGQRIRFGGHTIRPITTAEHALRVARFSRMLAMHMTDDAATHRDAYIWGLHHDDHDYVTPWGDCLRPGKTPEMRVAEAKIDTVIMAAMDWEPSSAVREIVDTADDAALYFEAMLWQTRGHDWAPAVWSGSDRSSLLNMLIPEAMPRPGETLVDAIVSGMWVGHAWLREVHKCWPHRVKPKSRHFIPRDMSWVLQTGACELTPEEIERLETFVKNSPQPRLIVLDHDPWEDVPVLTTEAEISNEIQIGLAHCATHGGGFSFDVDLSLKDVLESILKIYVPAPKYMWSFREERQKSNNKLVLTVQVED